MAGTPKSRASDYTGRQRDAEAKKHAEEQKKRSEEMAMVTAQAEEAMENEVVDLANPDAPEVVEVTEVKVNEKEVVIRVNEDIEMTFAGSTYKMKVGPKYKVPEHIADWLEERGIVWH